MNTLKLCESDYKFMTVIWDNEPVASGVLAKLAGETLNWKKTTSFTVLKRLCDRGLFENAGGEVRSLISREDYYARHSEQYVQETFGGSLPAFLAAFGTRKKLSDAEVEELQALIEQMRRE